MAGQDRPSNEPSRPAIGITSRDAVPDAADIDRGAIGSVGSSPRDAIMRGAAFAAVAAVVGVFFVTQTGPQNAAAKSDAERRAEATPVKAVVDYSQVAQGASSPRLASAAQDPNAPLLDQQAALASQRVPALSPEDPGAAHADRGGQRNPAQVMADAKRRAPLLAFGGSAGSTRDDLTRLTAAHPLSSSMSGAGDDADEPNELDRLRRQSAIKQSRASMIGNRDYLITAGTLIPCVLQTALSSAQPGYTTCVIPQDIFSDNGNVVLMEKGTKVIGEYRGGLNQGQNRLFVLWTRAVTPRGVAIDLASPGSDALGRAGFAGAVDTFFWKRFGGALLLSLIDDGMQVAGQALANQGSNTTQVPSGAASVALQNSINIKPVLRKNQGEEVGIFVAQDFNFADVYDLRLKR